MFDTTLRALRQRLRPSRLPEQRREPGDLEVQLAFPAWTPVRSTDREYVYERFPRLSQAFRVHFTGNYGARCIARRSLKYGAARLGLPLPRDAYLRDLHVPAYIAAVFAYGEYPIDLRADVPVLYEQTFAPQRGVDPVAWSATTRATHLQAARKATRVVTATEVSADWFRRVFPEAAHKVCAVPYYLPELRAISLAELDRKAAEGGPLRVIFVGKQGHRKGLDSLVAAWSLLDTATRQQLQVRIVSALLDGPLSLPASWTHHARVPDVQALMRESHVLAFPTKQEAYGLVLVEGMAAGCALLTTCAEIQRSIVGEAAGLFVDPTAPHEIAGSLTRLVADRQELRQRMHAARERFIARHEPAVVGERYAQLLWQTAGRSASDVWRP